MESTPQSRAQLAAQARVVVAQRAQVELLDPAARVVHEGQPVQQRRLELQRLAAAGGLPGARASKEAATAASA